MHCCDKAAVACSAIVNTSGLDSAAQQAAAGSCDSHGAILITHQCYCAIYNEVLL